MAHQIENLTGTQGGASFVSARQHAWHQLGVVLPEAFDAADAMRYAKLGGWQVRKLALQTEPRITSDGVTGPVSVPEAFATVRTNPVTGGVDVLGVVGTDYTVIQNEEHADVLNAITDESGAHFETAGSLRGGRTVFLSMKLPKTMQVGGVDPVDLYLVASNSHDGTSAFRLMVTPVRVMCANTLSAAIRGARSSFSVRHTCGARASVSQAREALRLTWRFTDAFQAEADRMIETAVADDEFARIMAQVWPTDTEQTAPAGADQRAAQVLALRWTSTTIADAIRPTRWGAYQAVTEYLDWYAPTRGRADKQLARAERTAIGTVPAVKARAFALLAN